MLEKLHWYHFLGQIMLYRIYTFWSCQTEFYALSFDETSCMRILVVLWYRIINFTLFYFLNTEICSFLKNQIDATANSICVYRYEFNMVRIFIRHTKHTKVLTFFGFYDGSLNFGFYHFIFVNLIHLFQNFTYFIWIFMWA